MASLIPDDIAAVIGNYSAGQRRIALLTENGSLLVLDRARNFDQSIETVHADVIPPPGWDEWRKALVKARLMEAK